MDNTTEDLINQFLNFLNKEFAHEKHLRHVQFEKWSLENNRIAFKYFYHEHKGCVYVDIRELKDNENHFMHLLDNITAQLNITKER